MALGDIDHFVVLMLENRSFDSMLGRLYSGREDYDGLKGDEFNLDKDGNRVEAWNSEGLDNASMSVPDPDPGELWLDINEQLFGTKPITDPSAADMSGFVRNYQSQTDSPPYPARNVMHYYTPDQLPVMSALARQFAVSDRWHASAPCQTWPNRFFVHCGTAGGYENNGPPHFPYLMPTIFKQLEDAGIPWRVYFHDFPQSLTLADLWPHVGNFRLFEEFVSDCAAGTLPAYSFLEPRYFAGLELPNDQHPPHNVTMGEQLIAEVYNALRSGPNWTGTMLIVTYDEHGGIYDHVPPPGAQPPSGQETKPFKFDRYGVRVPALVISPYVAPGTVLRPDGGRVFDHTSIMATLCRRYGLEPLTDRVKVAPDLDGALTRSTPDNLGPERIAALPYEPTQDELDRATRIPRNSHQKELAAFAGSMPRLQIHAGADAAVANWWMHLQGKIAGVEQPLLQESADALQRLRNITNLLVVPPEYTRPPTSKPTVR
jgi:phospholipase C